MRLRNEKSGHDHVYIHIDDFKIVAKDPLIWIDCIASIFLTKEYGQCSYCLGNDYTYHVGENIWNYGIKPYTDEAISRVERIYGRLPKESTPTPVTD